MKKIFILLIIIIPLSYFYFKKDNNFYNTLQKTKQITITPDSPLVCKFCNPALKEDRKCLNCLYQGEITLKNGDTINGKIININDNIVLIKIDYGNINVPLENLAPPVIETKAAPPLPSSKKEKDKKSTADKVIKKQKEIKQEKIIIRNKSKIKKAVKDLFKKTNFIAYTPSNYMPGNESFINIEEIKKDLLLLKEYGYDAILSYSSKGNLKFIPQLAKEIGFNKVICGIFEPGDQQEINNALSMQQYSDAFCIGNEGLHFKDYSKELLMDKISYIKGKSSLPVTTSEPLDIILSSDYIDLLKECDWVFVIAHFIFDDDIKEITPSSGVKWLEEIHNAIKRKVPVKKLIAFKEVGFPTSGNTWANEKNQYQFIKKAMKKRINMIVFEAFDQPWKSSVAVEPHWGIFNRDRSPKKAAELLNKK